MRFSEFSELPILDEIFVSNDGVAIEVLREGKWIPGRFERNIRIDQPTHGVGQTHAHVFCRKGNEIGVVNFDGSASHGAKCRLSDADAAALKARGFQIRSGNIVEWVVLSGGQFNFLLEWLLSLQARWRPLINEIGGLAITQSKLATQSPSKKAGLRSVKVHPRDGRCGEVAVSGYPNPED